MSQLVAVTDLTLDEDLYPRAEVSEPHVREIERVMEGGHELPPIIVWRKNGKIVDGAHRWKAAIRRGDEFIAADYRDYADEQEFFRDAVLLNSATGLAFSSYDRVRVVEIAVKFKLSNLDVAVMLRTSESYIKTIAPRIATVTVEEKRGEVVTRAQRRVPLKASVRHLSGKEIRPEQERAITGNAPGTSYLLVVRQLISALENELLPPNEQHPALWQELRKLGGLIDQHTASLD